jgi:hypothetical protein
MIAEFWALVDIVAVLGLPVYAGYRVAKPLFSPRSPSSECFVYGRKV